MSQRLPTSASRREPLQETAEDCYVYGYPLVLMDVMRLLHISVPEPTAEGAPVNQFWHSPHLPEPHASFESRPHADGLRSTAWLDLSKQPVILNIPATERYYLLSLFTVWGDLFHAISPRTMTSNGGSIALAGPRWHGEVPDGVRRIVTPCDAIWINGLIHADSADDVQSAHGAQEQFRLALLSDRDKPPAPHPTPFRPNVDRKSKAVEQVERMPAEKFYTQLWKLLKKTPSMPCDAAIIERFAGIGFAADNFAFETLSATIVEAMNAAIPAAQAKIAHAAEVPAMKVNNWALWVHPSYSDTDYLSRAAAARNAFAHYLVEDVAAFHSLLDRSGDPLRGTHDYLIHFDRKHPPPVNGLWSVTVYDPKQQLPVNAIHRYVIGDRSRLRLDADNSLSIYLQHAWPGTLKDSNWLPTPKNAFELALRLFWPKADVISGMWRPPEVTRVR